MSVRAVPRIALPLLLGLVFVTAPTHAATLSVWELTTPLPAALAGHAMAATTTHLYALGGVDAVDVVPIHPDGSVGAWRATTSLTFP